MGKLPEARQALARVLAINPESSLSHSNMAQVELLQGHAGQALAMFQKADDGSRQFGVALAEHSLGHPSESQQALEELIARYAQDYAVQIAEIYPRRGEKDKAFEWLQCAYMQRDGGLSDIKFDVLLTACGQMGASPRWSGRWACRGNRFGTRVAAVGTTGTLSPLTLCPCSVGNAGRPGSRTSRW